MIQLEKNILLIQEIDFEEMFHVQTPASMEGMAKKAKLSNILNPILTNMPPMIGPKIPPKRPMPMAHPIPVLLIGVGYIPAAIAYKPTNPL
jgi:hypothetical protein